MSHEQEGSVFSASFLDRIDPDVFDDLTAEGVNEADSAGPWSIRQRQDGQYEVVAEGRAPVAAVASHETALLLAAALPVLGRSFFRITSGEAGTSRARLLINERGEAMGQLSAVHEELLAAHLNAFEYLRRSPLDLARVLYAARGPALRRAGAILWEWEQAAP